VIPFSLTISPTLRTLQIGARTWQLATWERHDWWRLASTDTGRQVTMWAASGKGCISVGNESWMLSDVASEGATMTASAEPVDFDAVAADVLGAGL
jgi:hypothetical protein